MKTEKAIGLHSTVRDAAIAFIDEANKIGLSVGIFSGFRSFQEQAAIYSEGRDKPGKVVTNAKPGMSFHNYGLALDAVFLEDSHWTWQGDFKQLGEIGKRHGFEWGGDFLGIKDFSHFQMSFGLKVETLLAEFEKGGPDATRAMIDEAIKKKSG